MNHLTYYSGRNTVFALAKQDDVCSELLEKKLHVLLFQNGQAVFQPENKELQLKQDEAEYFDQIKEYSVFRLSNDKKLQLYHDVSSLDNPLVITDRCNSNCIMCPLPEMYRRESRSMKLDELIALSKYIPDFTEHITITGGEPFLIRKDLFKLLEYLKYNFHETRFLLLTNGRVLASLEYAKLFQETKPDHIVVGIPIHGSNAKIHDHIVQTERAFEETVLGIRHLVDLGVQVELRLVVSKLNIDDITNIGQLIVSKFPTVLCVKIMGLEMLGNAAKNQDQVWITYKEAFEASKEAIEMMINAGIDVGLYNFPLCAVEKKYWPICEKSISDYKVRYAEQCEKCEVRDGCGGIFAGTIRLAKEYVQPVNL